MKELNDISGAVELVERIEADIWDLNAGTSFESPTEIADRVQFFLEDSNLGAFDEDPTSAAIWALTANRELLSFKDMWREHLITLLKMSGSE